MKVMEDTKKPAFEAKLLNEVARQVELDSIHCVALDARVLIFEDPTSNLSLEFSFNTQWRRVDSRPGFEVVFALTVSVLEQKKPGENVGLFSFKGVWHLNYTLPEIAPPDWDDRLTAFASMNSVVNAWPYARAEVQQCLAKAGLPGLMLPVYRAGRGTNGRAEFARVEREN